MTTCRWVLDEKGERPAIRCEKCRRLYGYVLNVEDLEHYRRTMRDEKHIEPFSRKAGLAK